MSNFNHHRKLKTPYIIIVIITLMMLIVVIQASSLSDRSSVYRMPSKLNSSRSLPPLSDGGNTVVLTGAGSHLSAEPAQLRRGLEDYHPPQAGVCHVERFGAIYYCHMIVT